MDEDCLFAVGFLVVEIVSISKSSFLEEAMRDNMHVIDN